MEQTVVRIRTLEIGSGMPKICVPVVGKTEKEILEGAERAKAAKPDLVEFRVDWYEEAADSKSSRTVRKASQMFGRTAGFIYLPKQQGRRRSCLKRQSISKLK